MGVLKRGDIKIKKRSESSGNKNRYERSRVSDSDQGVQSIDKLGEFKEGYILSGQEYGVLFPYMMNDSVKEVYINGRNVWINDRSKGKYMAPERLSKEHTDRLISMIINRSDGYDLLGDFYEIKNDHISVYILNKNAVRNGNIIRIVKHDTVKRYSEKTMLSKGVISEEGLSVLKSVVTDFGSFLIYGKGSISKEKIMGFMAGYVPQNERILSIGKTEETQLNMLYPDKDITEYIMPYDIKPGDLTHLCQAVRPDRVFASMVAGKSVMELISVMDSYLISGSMCINAAYENEIPDVCFPWCGIEDKKSYNKTLCRAFPIRIAVDNEGIYKIVCHESTGKRNLYERGV